MHLMFPFSEAARRRVVQGCGALGAASCRFGAGRLCPARGARERFGADSRYSADLHSRYSPRAWFLASPMFAAAAAAGESCIGHVAVHGGVRLPVVGVQGLGCEFARDALAGRTAARGTPMAARPDGGRTRVRGGRRQRSSGARRWCSRHQLSFRALSDLRSSVWGPVPRARPASPPPAGPPRRGPDAGGGAPGEGDCVRELAQVGPAVRTDAQVRPHPEPLARRHGLFEILGRLFRDLLAGRHALFPSFRLASGRAASPSMSTAGRLRYSRVAGAWRFPAAAAAPSTPPRRPANRTRARWAGGEGLQRSRPIRDSNWAGRPLPSALRCERGPRGEALGQMAVG
jgi:hypothetical protein